MKVYVKSVFEIVAVLALIALITVGLDRLPLAFAAGSSGARTVTYGHVLTTAPAASNHTSSDPTDTHAFGKPSDTGTVVTGSVQCDWAGITGTINATVQLNISDDGGVMWVPKSGATFTLAGASGAQVISLNNIITEQFYQVVYTAGSVTGGTVDCWLIAK